MKHLLVLILFILPVLNASALSKLDKGAFYKALSSGDASLIDNALAQLESEKATSTVNAYKGALTMKKAGFQKGAGAKVKIFKKGAKLLEDEINSNPSNTEFRFLRLTIQEHAPGILKYNKQLEEDKQAVLSGYKNLDAEVKTVVNNYAKDSRILKASDLK